MTTPDAIKDGLRALKAAVEHYYSEEYLFEPENSYFRDCVAPELSEADEDSAGDAATPTVSCASLLNLPEIQAALSQLASATEGDASSENSMTEDAQAKWIAEAVADSHVVSLAPLDNPSAAGGDSATAPLRGIRRREPLDPQRNPALRTVVARPLPIHLTLNEVAEFFAKLGGGGVVERIKPIRQNANVVAGAGGSTAAVSSSSSALSPSTALDAKKVNPFWCAYNVRFATVADAKKAVAHFTVAPTTTASSNDDVHLSSDNEETGSAPASKRARADLVNDGISGHRGGESAKAAADRVAHFGPTACALVQRFFPARLYVSPLREYEETQRQKRRALEERQLRQNVLKAQTLLSRAQATEEPVRHYLRKGVTVVAEGLPTGISWALVKKALGELGSESAKVKGCVQLVQIAEGDSGSRKAFVVCRSPEQAQELVTVFSLCGDAKVKEEVKKVVPSLRPVTEEEEAFCQLQFPAWCAPKVTRKVQANQRRGKHYH